MAMERLSVFGKITREGEGGVRWAHWVNDPGSNNIQDPFIGGEPSSEPYCVIDLSGAASELLGRQMTQSAKYRLRGFTVAFRNDDTGTNNESDTAYSGTMKWYPDTAHFREALSLARQVEKANEADEMDADSFYLSNEKDYSAVRFGWSAADDVAFQTTEGIAGLLVGQWTLEEVKILYNLMTEPNETNAMFNGRFPTNMCHAWDSIVGGGTQVPAVSGQSNVMHSDFHSGSLFHLVGAGLLTCAITHSSCEEQQGLDEDEHTWWIGLDFEVSV